MANTFLNLPALAANGPGTAVDVSGMGAIKTVTVGKTGSVFQPFVTIEVACDAAGLIWTPLKTFQGAGQQTFIVACLWMRATVSNYRGGAAPNCDVGSDDSGASALNLPVLASNGSAAAVDVSDLPNFKTVQVGGTFRGTVNIELSEDGTDYETVASFTNAGGQKSGVFAAQFMRVTRAGVPLVAPGTPEVNVAACDGMSGGGGDATVQSFTYRPGGADNGPSVFNTWADLYTALDTARTTAQGGGSFEIIFDDTDTSPCVIPIGAYDMTGVRWRGVNSFSGVRTVGLVAVSFAGGVDITHLMQITGLSITNAASASAAITLTDDETLWLEATTLSPTVPMILFDGAGDTSLLIGNQCDIGVASIELDGGGTLTTTVYGAGSSVRDTSITNTNGTAIFQVDNSASQFNGAQPPPANTVYEQNTAPVTWPFDNGDIQTAGAEVDVNTITLYDGTQSQTFDLPTIDSRDHGRIVMFKETTGLATAVQPVAITTSAAGGIDGLETVYALQPNESYTLMADARNDTWHVIQHLKSPLQARLSAPTAAIANTETVVISFIAPPNFFKVGTVMRFKGVALRAGVNNNAPTIRIRIGPVTLTGAIVWSEGGLLINAAGNLQVEASVVITAIGAAGAASSGGWSGMNSTAIVTVNHVARSTAVAIDTTVQNLVELTLISGNAGNSYTFDIGEIFVY